MEMKKLRVASVAGSEHCEQLFRYAKGDKIVEMYFLLKAFPELVNARD